MSSNSIVKSNGVVCFLDLLGAKGGWRNAETMISVWDTLFDTLNVLAGHLKSKYDTDLTNYSFSDTIVMTAPFNQTNNQKAFYNLAGVIAFMLPRFFSEKLLLRGCISVGDYYTSKARRMLIGPAVDEAVQYHAQAEWAGVSLAPSAHLFVVENHRSAPHWGVIDYPIPLKGTIENDGIALKWVDVDKLDEAKSIRELLVNELKHSTDVTVSLKLRNTINFIDYVLKKEGKPPNDASETPEKSK